MTRTGSLGLADLCRSKFSAGQKNFLPSTGSKRTNVLVEARFVALAAALALPYVNFLATKDHRPNAFILTFSMCRWRDTVLSRGEYLASNSGVLAVLLLEFMRQLLDKATWQLVNKATDKFWPPPLTEVVSIPPKFLDAQTNGR